MPLYPAGADHQHLSLSRQRPLLATRRGCPSRFKEKRRETCSSTTCVTIASRFPCPDLGAVRRASIRRGTRSGPCHSFSGNRRSGTTTATVNVRYCKQGASERHPVFEGGVGAHWIIESHGSMSRMTRLCAERAQAGGQHSATKADAACDRFVPRCTSSHTVQRGFAIDWLASPSGPGGRTLFRGC
jgi:hypothetical protein